MSAFPGWLYKKPITVTNNIASALTNFQIKIIVDTAALITAGKMQSGGQDIRFADADDSTSLSYWIKPGTINTITTEIWVKVSLTASQVKDIYMYYGKSDASADSSISNTFVYGDDFSTDTSGNYTTSGGAISVDTINKWLKLTGVSNGNTIASPTTQTNPASYIVEAEIKLTGQIAATDYVGGLLGFKSTLTGSDGYVTEFGNLSSAQKVSLEKFNVAHLTTATITFSNGTFYPMLGRFVNATLRANFNNATNADSTDASYTNGKYGMRGYNSDTYFKNFRVREYASTEPSTSVGAEQNAGQSYTQTATENVSFSDTLVKSVVRNLSETTSFTATLLRGITKNLPETVTFTDTISRSIGKVLTESVSFLDTLEKRIDKIFAETVTFADSLTKGISRTLSESVNFLDTLGDFILNNIRAGINNIIRSTRSDKPEGGTSDQKPNGFTSSDKPERR